MIKFRKRDVAVSSAIFYKGLALEFCFCIQEKLSKGIGSSNNNLKFRGILCIN